MNVEELKLENNWTKFSPLSDMVFVNDIWTSTCVVSNCG